MRTTKQDNPALAAAFGKALTSARARTDLTQDEAASCSGMGTTSLWRLENGARLPDLAQLSRLADTYRVSITWIVESAEEIMGAVDEGEARPGTPLE